MDVASMTWRRIATTAAPATRLVPLIRRTQCIRASIANASLPARQATTIVMVSLPMDARSPKLTGMSITAAPAATAAHFATASSVRPFVSTRLVKLSVTIRTSRAAHLCSARSRSYKTLTIAARVEINALALPISLQPSTLVASTASAPRSPASLVLVTASMSRTACARLLFPALPHTVVPAETTARQAFSTWKQCSVETASVIMASVFQDIATATATAPTAARRTLPKIPTTAVTVTPSAKDPM